MAKYVVLVPIGNGVVAGVGTDCSDEIGIKEKTRRMWSLEYRFRFRWSVVDSLVAEHIAVVAVEHIVVRKLPVGVVAAVEVVSKRSAAAEKEGMTDTPAAVAAAAAGHADSCATRWAALAQACRLQVMSHRSCAWKKRLTGAAEAVAIREQEAKEREPFQGSSLNHHRLHLPRLGVASRCSRSTWMKGYRWC